MLKKTNYVLVCSNFRFTWLFLFNLLLLGFTGSSCKDDDAGALDKKQNIFNVLATTTDGSSLFGSTLRVMAKTADKQTVWQETFTIESNTVIEVPLAERYSFIFSKSGYVTHAQHYLADDLKGIDNLHFELIPNGSKDFIVMNLFEGEVTVYYPANREKLYARIDLKEDFRLSYMLADKDASDINDVPLMDAIIVETFSHPLPAYSINLFGNVPFQLAPNIKDEVDMETSDVTEDFDRDVRIESNLILSGTSEELFEAHFFDWNFDKSEALDYWCAKIPDLCSPSTKSTN